MTRTLEEHWKVSTDEAELVAQMSVHRTIRDSDDHRVRRSFYEMTRREERIAFVKCLFQVAAACNKASHQEIENIRTIANALKLDHRDFIAAKLTIPSEQRPGH